MSGGHLENIGQPVVLENVSGGHFEKKERKKKRLLLPFFHRGRDAKHVCFVYFALVSYYEIQLLFRHNVHHMK